MPQEERGGREAAVAAAEGELDGAGGGSDLKTIEAVEEAPEIGG